MSNRIPMIPPYRVLSRVSILSEVQDYNIQMMNVPAMWRHTMGEGVKVVILDTGMPQHVDLAPVGGKSFVPGYSFDMNGHGTHTAGILAAISNNGMGISGVAPNIDDYYGTVLDANGSGDISEIIAGIMWAVDEIGAQIISMSLGIPAGVPLVKELEAACNYARSKGVTVFAAAGNEGGRIGQPACFDSVVAVAAVDKNRNHIWFSNTGQQVDFACGGVDVYSTYLNNGYAKLSGTSMACPAMAGVGALIQADELKDHGKFLTPDELIDKMKKISYDVGRAGFDELYGNGIPIFNNIGEPDEPTATPTPAPQPEPTPQPPVTKKASFPCGMTWSLMGSFADAAGKAAKEGANSDGAIMAGFQAVGRMAGKLSTQMSHGSWQPE